MQLKSYLEFLLVNQIFVGCLQAGVSGELLFVPTIIKVSRKILFLATVLINLDILMCVMIGHLMNSHLYPVIN